MCRTLIALVVLLLLVSPAPGQQEFKLPATWRLPPYDEAEKLKLLDLPGNLGDPLDLAIRSDAAELPKGAVIVAEAASDRLSWLVKAIDNPTAKAPRAVNLATITREGYSLYLAWSQPLATPVLRRQVTNCLLALRIGRASGTVQLRQPPRRLGPTLRTEP